MIVWINSKWIDLLFLVTNKWMYEWMNEYDLLVPIHQLPILCLFDVFGFRLISPLSSIIFECWIHSLQHTPNAVLPILNGLYGLIPAFIDYFCHFSHSLSIKSQHWSNCFLYLLANKSTLDKRTSLIMDFDLNGRKYSM